MSTEYERKVLEDSQRVARRMNELIEKREELSKCLFQYQGPPIVSENCILNPGDILVQDGNSVISSRGVQIELQRQEMADLIADGVFDQMIRPSDINQPNFNKDLNRIMEIMQMQANYRDADVYKKDAENDEYYALYLDKEDPNKVISAIQCIGGAYYTRKAINATIDMFDDLDESDYLEFNPNQTSIPDEIQKTALSSSHAVVDSSVDIAETAVEAAKDVNFTNAVIKEAGETTKAAVKSVSDATVDSIQAGYDDVNPGRKVVKEEVQKTSNSERQNTGSKFQAMKEQYDANGRNNVPTMEDIMEDDKMSAKDKLAAMKELQDQERENMQNIEDQEDLSPLATSKAMRYVQ